MWTTKHNYNLLFMAQPIQTVLIIQVTPFGNIDMYLSISSFQKYNSGKTSFMTDIFYL